MPDESWVENSIQGVFVITLKSKDKSQIPIVRRVTCQGEKQLNLNFKFKVSNHVSCRAGTV